MHVALAMQSALCNSTATARQRSKEGPAAGTQDSLSQVIRRFLLFLATPSTLSLWCTCKNDYRKNPNYNLCLWYNGRPCQEGPEARILYALSTPIGGPDPATAASG